MNQIKLKIWKEVCDNFAETEDFINSEIEEICYPQKFSIKEVTYFLFMYWC